MAQHARALPPQEAGAGPGHDGCAAVAVAFPEPDGIRLTLLGLHNFDGTTVLDGHASGMTPDGQPDFPLTVWVRDSGGRWHTTRAAARRWGAENDREMMRLEVVPPLRRAT